MNYVDIIVLSILALVILMGYYRGFLMSIFSIANLLVSCLLALLMLPLFSGVLKNNEQLMNMMLYYTEGSEQLADVEQARLNVAELSSEQLDEIISGAQLARPYDSLVKSNIAQEIFADEGITTVGDYFNRTIVCVGINILLFIVSFAILYVVINLVLRAIDYSRPFPMLKQFDNLLGAGVGLMRATLLVFVIFTIVPLMLVILPEGFSSTIQHYLDQSFFGTFFYESNFLLNLIPGV